MITLTPVEARVLGSLVEKEITTPEYYPMTVNALVNACNQKNNRDPVVHYDDATVEDALDSLRHKGLVVERSGTGMRVPKYAHRMQEKINLGRREMAVLNVLMLRGPQTPGELRGRAGRMHSFSDLEEVELTLSRLAEFDGGPIAMKLPRQPGMKEHRWAHLLSGEPPEDVATPQTHETPRTDRISTLEQEVAQLRGELAELRAVVDRLRAVLD